MATTAFNSDVTCQALGATSLTVNGGNTVARIISGTTTVDFASMGANVSVVVTTPVAGAAVGDTVVTNLGSNWSGDYLNINVISQVTTAGVVAFTASNKSAGTINPDSTTARYTVFGF